MDNLKKAIISYKQISLWTVIASLSGAGVSSVSIQYEHNKIYGNRNNRKSSCS